MIDKTCMDLGMMRPYCNPSTQEAEAEEKKKKDFEFEASLGDTA
jgi:hypothetical protein